MSLLNQTESEKLLSNLRGEIGEIIEAYLLLRFYDMKAYQRQTDDFVKDAENNELQIINKTRTKFRNDIILRLSELSSSKHGRLNFTFAAEKFKIDKKQVSEFKKYLNDKHLVFKRNNNIAHKRVSPRSTQMDPDPHISRCAILRAIGWTIILMKSIDEKYYGIEYKKLWREEREKRYELRMPASARYMLLPYVARIEKEKR